MNTEAHTREGKEKDGRSYRFRLRSGLQRPARCANPDTHNADKVARDRVRDHVRDQRLSGLAEAATCNAKAA